MPFNPERINIKDLTIEEPEKQAEVFSGRDPEKLLTEFFDWSETNTDFLKRDEFWFNIFNKKIFSMGPDSANKVPSQFIDRETDESLYSDTDRAESSKGISQLLLHLKNKRVVSVNSRGDWILEVIEPGTVEKPLETKNEPMPEVRNF